MARAEFGEDALFVEGEFLHHGGIGDRDFEPAAADLPGRLSAASGSPAAADQASASCSLASMRP